MGIEKRTMKDFDDYVSIISDIFDSKRELPLEDRKKYEELEMIFLDLLKSNKPEREDEVLDFLLETNVSEFDSFQYAVLKISQDFSENQDAVKHHILKAFKNRLHKLESKPNYQHLHLDNWAINPFFNLKIYLDQGLSLYDSPKLAIELPVISKDKIKTKLSVPQISLLFDLLFDEGLIECTDKSELSTQIASSFSSTGEDDISVKSVKNNLVTPDNDAIKFWKTELVRLKELLDKY